MSRAEALAALQKIDAPRTAGRRMLRAAWNARVAPVVLPASWSTESCAWSSTTASRGITR